MNFNDITIGQLLVFIASITAIIAFVSKVTSPYTTLKARVEKIEKNQDNDFERLKALEDDTRMILKATRVLILHSVSANNTGELKKVQDEIDEYLINK